MRKIIPIVSFLFYGIIVGYGVGLYDRIHDTPLYLNIPGYLLGEAFTGLWIRFVSHIAPWILTRPQVYVLTSILFWGLVGTLLAVFIKPKIIAWIVSVYLVIFGTLTILVEFF